MDKSYISIKDLSKKFNENKIINNLSIEIDKGDLVKISGKNGSGKTTFLKIFSQLYTFDEGNIFIKGQQINKNSYLKSIISYCSSDSIFYKDLSVKNNIIPHTTNTEEPDVDYPALVLNKPVEKPINTALSNSFGFGGNNSTILFKKYAS